MRHGAVLAAIAFLSACGSERTPTETTAQLLPQEIGRAHV